MKQITGNKLLVKALKEEGVEYLFGYPGACTIDISDELYKQDEIKIVLPRHEQALVHEADAYARTTGKVGVCLVTSGTWCNQPGHRSCNGKLRQRSACLLHRTGSPPPHRKRCIPGG